MKLIAHRGGAGLRVENTLAAFEHAIELGADGAELDVHLSADGQVVVHHDEHLNRNYCRHAEGNWISAKERLPLSELTAAQMHSYDIGAPRPETAYARAFDRITPVVGQRIPLLREVIERAKARSDDFFLLIEIKASLLSSSAQTLQAVADATLALIEQTDFADRTILCSFDWGTMRHCKAQWPAIPTWYITPPLSWFAPGTPPATDIPPRAAHLARVREQYASGAAPWFAGYDPQRFDGSCVQAVAAAGGDAWYPFHRDCTAASCRQSAQLGLDSAAWTVNLRDPAALQQVADCGIGNLTVDYPDWRPD